jgi:hypothetical protein
MKVDGYIALELIDLVKENDGKWIHRMRIQCLLIAYYIIISHTEAKYYVPFLVVGCLPYLWTSLAEGCLSVSWPAISPSPISYPLGERYAGGRADLGSLCSGKQEDVTTLAAFKACHKRFAQKLDGDVV